MTLNRDEKRKRENGVNEIGWYEDMGEVAEWNQRQVK